MLSSDSYFLFFYYIYNNGYNNNIQILLDSSQCDQLPVANFQTLWTIYNLEIDNVTAGNHIITLQGCDPSFNNTSIRICNVRLLLIIQGA